MKHIEFAKLVEKFEGRLSNDEEREIADHIADCGDCDSESARLADFFAYANLEESESVPQAVTARILNIYQLRPLPKQTTSDKPHGAGFLIFDDWTISLNERYSGLDTRQMLFRINEYDIDLRFEFVGDMCRLTGQLFPEISGASVEIFSSSHSASAMLNEMGEFALDPLPQNIYDVRITGADEELFVKKIPLQR
jgi:hypothetical protein